MYIWNSVFLCNHNFMIIGKLIVLLQIIWFYNSYSVFPQAYIFNIWSLSFLKFIFVLPALFFNLDYLSPFVFHYNEYFENARQSVSKISSCSEFPLLFSFINSGVTLLTKLYIDVICLLVLLCQPSVSTNFFGYLRQNK